MTVKYADPNGAVWNIIDVDGGVIASLDDEQEGTVQSYAAAQDLGPITSLDAGKTGLTAADAMKQTINAWATQHKAERILVAHVKRPFPWWVLVAAVLMMKRRR